MICPVCNSPTKVSRTAPIDCGERSFTQGWGSLSEHSVHIRERKYQCAECGHTFLTVESRVGQYRTTKYSKGKK